MALYLVTSLIYHVVIESMPINEQLADRIRESLQHLRQVEEKKMFGGLCFMVDGKMCVGITGKGFVFVGPEGHDDLGYWMNLALEYNKIAKSSKKKQK